MSEAREIDVSEHPEVPWLSVVLGYGPMLPLVAGAVAAWMLGGAWRGEAVLLATSWAAAILGFLAGVRRGLSFRTAGGPRASQIATMLGLFVLALGAFLLLAHGLALPATACVLLGFASMAVLDPLAARDGEAPLFFARLRPPQMMIAVVSLVALLANVWRHG